MSIISYPSCNSVLSLPAWQLNNLYSSQENKDSFPHDSLSLPSVTWAAPVILPPPRSHLSRSWLPNPPQTITRFFAMSFNRFVRKRWRKSLRCLCGRLSVWLVFGVETTLYSGFGAATFAHRWRWNILSSGPVLKCKYFMPLKSNQFNTCWTQKEEPHRYSRCLQQWVLHRLTMHVPHPYRIAGTETLQHACFLLLLWCLACWV